MRRIVFTKTVFVPSMTFSRLAFIIGIVHNAGAGRSVVNHPVSAVQNRCFVLADDLVEVYRVALGLAAVQQIADFAALELFCDFAAIFIFCVCEVVAICDWANIVSTYTAYIST